jgi:Methionine synthase I (cobalamin-dependent), methyltransferase domain
VITNTYMSGSGPMHRAGAGDRFAEGIANAVEAAQQAVQAAAERPVAIAGSVGVTRWGQPESDSRSGLRDDYARAMELLAEGGVDLIALEMVTDPRLAEAALEAALERGLPVWLGLSMRAVGRDQAGYDSLRDITEAQTVVQACLTSSLDAVNVMHTEIDDVVPAIAMLRPLWDGPRACIRIAAGGLRRNGASSTSTLTSSWSSPGPGSSSGRRWWEAAAAYAPITSRRCARRSTPACPPDL